MFYAVWVDINHNFIYEPDERLAAWQWERCAERQRSLYDGLLPRQSDAP